MMRRFAWSALVAVVVAAPTLIAQDAAPKPKAQKPPISTQPWPEDDVLDARRNEAQNRRLFQDEASLEFTLASDFHAINKERTPNNGKRFPGVLTVDGRDIPVKLGSRGHLRLKATTCDFVPIKVDFPSKDLAGTVFEGQTT